MPFPTEMKFVRRTEERLGVLLPASYTRAMCRENGGKVFVGEDDWQLHPLLDDTDRTRLKRTCNDVVRETGEARKWAEFPATAVCIGGNGSGDMLVFLPDANDATRLSEVVYYWDHETGHIEAVAGEFAEIQR